MKVEISSSGRLETVGAPRKRRSYWHGEIRAHFKGNTIVQPIKSHDELYPSELEPWIHEDITSPLFAEHGEPDYFKVTLTSCAQPN